MAAMAGEGTVDSDSSDLAKGEEHKIVPWRAFQKLFAHEPQGWSSMIGYRAPSYDWPPRKVIKIQKIISTTNLHHFVARVPVRVVTLLKMSFGKLYSFVVRSHVCNTSFTTVPCFTFRWILTKLPRPGQCALYCTACRCESQ
jgi:hypothetical protein